MRRYKIIRIVPELKNGFYWRKGEYLIWGNSEVIMDHWTAEDEHTRYAHAVPFVFKRLPAPWLEARFLVGAGGFEPSTSAV